MNWSVTYRAKDGKTAVETVEAASREELFKALSARGINAIRIEEANARQRNSSESDTLRRVLILGAVGIAAAIGAFIAAKYLGKDKSAISPATEKPKRIVSATPQIASRPQEVENAEGKSVRFWELDAAHTNGLTAMQMRKWEKMHRPPPGYTNNAVLLRKKPAYAIFNHNCENLIAAYLTLKPGEGMVGTPRLGEGFRQQFLKSLEEPIIVTAEDSPEDAQLKRDMIATKIDLKAWMDAGEDICKIINDTHKEVQDLARYKSMLQKELREAAKNPDMTMEDVDILVEAANKMLDEKGIAPLTLGPISRRLIQRRKGL